MMSEDQSGRDIISWGSGEFGQHGHENREDDVLFVQGAITTSTLKEQIKMAACGSSHTVVVTVDDDIFTWGNGTCGQLGNCDLSSQCQPFKVLLDPPLPNNVTVSCVACGSRHTMIVLTNGHVYVFGNNSYRQLGYKYDFKTEDSYENLSSPGLIRDLVHRPVSKVACGDKHSIFLFMDGTVSVYGDNSHGQLGDNTRMPTPSPRPAELDFRVTNIASGSNHNLVLSDTGDVYVWGYCKGCGHSRRDVLRPELKLQGRQIVQIAGGSTHSLALANNGDIYTWGFGSDGQLGQGEQQLRLAKPRRLQCKDLHRRVSYIDCGEAYSAAVTCDGQLYMWGKNSHVINHSDRPSDSSYHPVLMGGGGDESGIHSVHCGAWHAVALSGQPDHQPAVSGGKSESEDSDTDQDTNSECSDAMSRSDSVTPKLPDTEVQDLALLNTGSVETSVPHIGLGNSLSPRLTSSSALRPPKSGGPEFPSRGQTRLTLGEFYAMTDSSPSQNSSSRSGSKASENNRDDLEKLTTEPSSNTILTTKSIEIQAPTPQEDEKRENQLHSYKKEEKNEEDIMSSPKSIIPPKSRISSSSASSSKSDVSESSLKKRMDENLKSDSAIQFRIRDVSGSQRARRNLISLPVVSSPRHEFQPKILTPRSPSTNIKSPAPSDRAHTMFISKSTAEHFVLPREPTFLARQSMGLVDLTQLKNGSLFENEDMHSQEFSNCSSRLDLQSPSEDLELRELMGQKTPKYHQSASETPSSMGRQIRAHEMLGSASGMNAPGSSTVFATPSPNFARLAHERSLMNDANLQLMRSRTVYSHMGRGPKKFYRKPGLPGSMPRSNQMKSAPGQHFFTGYPYSNMANFVSPRSPVDQNSHEHLGLLLGPSKPRETFKPDRNLNNHTTPFATALGVQTHLENRISRIGQNEVGNKRTIFSSASPWRTRMNTTLGHEKPETAKKTRQPTLIKPKPPLPVNGNSLGHIQSAQSSRHPRTSSAFDAKVGNSQLPLMFSDIHKEPHNSKTGNTSDINLNASLKKKKVDSYSHKKTKS